jgi:hypothetical protein
MVEASKSTNWPCVLIYDLVKRPNKKYMPNDVTALVEMTTTLSKLKLAKR